MSMKKTKVTINRWLAIASALHVTSSIVACIIAARNGILIDMMKFAVIFSFFFFFLLLMLKDDASKSRERLFVSIALGFAFVYAFLIVGVECRVGNILRFAGILCFVIALIFNWTWFKEECLS